MSGRHQPENGADSIEELEAIVDAAVNLWIDNLETLLTAIRQREMSREQRDRYARILAGAERDVLERGYRGR